MKKLTPRQLWMATLAKAPVFQLEQQVATLGELPGYVCLRPPEMGLVMVQGRAGGTGDPFYLGEMPLTRCVVQLDLSGEAGAIAGFGYVAGRSHRHAELAALCDALLQHPLWFSRVQAQVIVHLQEIAQQQRDRQDRQVEATRVNFFTLLRGESS